MANPGRSSDVSVWALRLADLVHPPNEKTSEIGGNSRPSGDLTRVDGSTDLPDVDDVDRKHPEACQPCVFQFRTLGCPDRPRCGYCHGDHEQPRWRIRKSTRDKIKEKVLQLLEHSEGSEAGEVRAELQAEAAKNPYVRQVVCGFYRRLPSVPPVLAADLCEEERTPYPAEDVRTQKSFWL
ncbi:unnamed protein product [Durusdinium trenchii]|uniref:C3H1-type domain-containing protein n=1 Tax=Durusdinium trenchii TaxID=1381693 RepID=A0ABP0HK60_9DINO